MTNSKSYTVTILIKPSRVNGLGISSGLIHDEKMNIVTDYVCQWLSVTVCKSVSKKSSRINKFLVVAALLCGAPVITGHGEARRGALQHHGDRANLSRQPRRLEALRRSMATTAAMAELW